MAASMHQFTDDQFTDGIVTEQIGKFRLIMGIFAHYI